MSPSLVRGFHFPAEPITLRPWTGSPAGPGVYIEPGVLATPETVAIPFTQPEPGVVRLAWDPEASVQRLVTEAYVPAGRPWHSRLAVPSGWIPSAVREALLRASVAPRLRAEGFPGWPVESLVEDIRTIVRAAEAASGRRRSPEPLWPGGHTWAAVLSHDFDSLDAFRHDRWKALAEIEEAHGLRSSWHVCSEHLPAAFRALETLAARGHEIAWHGPRHDYRFAFRPTERIRREAAAAALSLGAFAPRGFRSPNFLRTPGLLAGLEDVFGYDSSARDTAAELFGAPGRQGCCTVFPFFHGRLLELPVTIPDDLSIRCLYGDDAERIATVQAGKLGWIRSRAGMALALTHPESWISVTPGALKAYGKLVEAVAADPDAWRALPRDVEAWWRGRSGAPT